VHSIGYVEAERFRARPTPVVALRLSARRRNSSLDRISVEVADVDAVHARAVEQGFEIAYSLRDEEWGVRRFMLREPSGTVVNVLSHRGREVT